MATPVRVGLRHMAASVSVPVAHVDASEGEGVADGAETGDPIPGLEPSPRRRSLLLVVLGVLLAGVLVIALVPRTLATGETPLGEPYEVRVTPGVLAPTAHIELAGTSHQVRGERWPGAASATVLHLAGQHTVVVGSAPLEADSVRVMTAGRGVVEARVHLVGWHKIHVSVLQAPATVTETVAIGAEGQILEVVEPGAPVEVEPTP